MLVAKTEETFGRIAYWPQGQGRVPRFVNHLFNIHFTINRNNNVTSMTINCLSSEYSSDTNIKFKDTYIRIINNRRVFYFKDIITFIHKHFKINNRTLL